MHSSCGSLVCVMAASFRGRWSHASELSVHWSDDLVKALGLDGISKSQVSRLREELDTKVERFRTRKLEGTYPYVWLDATFLKVRQYHRVMNMPVVIAVGLNAATGQRAVPGAEGDPADGSRHHSHHIRPAVRGDIDMAGDRNTHPPESAGLSLVDFLFTTVIAVGLTGAGSNGGLLAERWVQRGLLPSASDWGNLGVLALGFLTTAVSWYLVWLELHPRPASCT